MGILGKPFFRGQSVHRLDAKGRLRIPTKYREICKKHYTDGLILTLMGDYLVAYPPEVWESTIESKAENLSQVRAKDRESIRRLIAYATECEFDSHGRILIAPQLRREAGLNQEVLVAGTMKSFEIWDLAAWDSRKLDRESHERLMDHIADSAGL